VLCASYIPVWSASYIPVWSASHPCSCYLEIGRLLIPGFFYVLEFYLILNVAVGSTNGWFPEGQGNKPWLDQAQSEFASRSNSWWRLCPCYLPSRSPARLRQGHRAVVPDVAIECRGPRVGRVRRFSFCGWGCAHFTDGAAILSGYLLDSVLVHCSHHLPPFLCCVCRAVTMSRCGSTAERWKHLGRTNAVTADRWMHRQSPPSAVECASSYPHSTIVATWI
jgi:hypothetical protein